MWVSVLRTDRPLVPLAEVHVPDDGPQVVVPSGGPRTRQTLVSPEVDGAESRVVPSRLSVVP